MFDFFRDLFGKDDDETDKIFGIENDDNDFSWSPDLSGDLGETDMELADLYASRSDASGGGEHASTIFGANELINYLEGTPENILRFVEVDEGVYEIYRYPSD